MRRTKKFAASVFASVFVAFSAAVPFAGAANQQQNGLVNVAVGDITIQDVNVGVAAGIAATVCGLKVGPVAALGTAVDRSGTTRTVCETDSGPVTISQA
jgi:hypothetical protein